MANMLTFPMILAVNSIVTEPPVATLPNRVAIEVRTPLGLGVLEMSLDGAIELAAKLSTHLQARNSR